MILSPHPMTLTVARLQQEQLQAEAARRRLAREARRPSAAVSPAPQRPPRFDWLVTLFAALARHPQPAR